MKMNITLMHGNWCGYQYIFDAMKSNVMKFNLKRVMQIADTFVGVCVCVCVYVCVCVCVCVCV